ncbi:hypothetical protein pb186bvf_019246 [Paramecium bursaria]
MFKMQTISIILLQIYSIQMNHIKIVKERNKGLSFQESIVYQPKITKQIYKKKFLRKDRFPKYNDYQLLLTYSGYIYNPIIKILIKQIGNI